MNLNRKITSDKTKHLLVENQLKKLEAFHSIYFRGKSHFEDNGTQNCLVFQPIQRYFKIVLMIIIYYHGNLKDGLMKVLSLLHLIKCTILH